MDIPKKTKEEKLALLEETFNYYNDNVARRCRTAFKCRYSGVSIDNPYTDGCAIGRLLTPELRLKLDVQYHGVPVNSEGVWKLIPDEIKAYGSEFLRHLQLFHDHQHFWDFKGISSQGLQELSLIKSRINIEAY